MWKQETTPPHWTSCPFFFSRVFLRQDTYISRLKNSQNLRFYVPSGKAIEVSPKLFFKTRNCSLWDIQFPKSTKNLVVNFNLLPLLSVLVPPRIANSATATLCISHIHHIESKTTTTSPTETRQHFIQNSKIRNERDPSQA